MERFLDTGVREGGTPDPNDGDVSGQPGIVDAWTVKLSGAGVGIAEQYEPEITTYADPCYGILSITAGQEAGAMDLLLFDASGRQVLQAKMTGSTQVLDLSERPCGLYLLELRTANGVRTERIVLE